MRQAAKEVCCQTMALICRAFLSLCVFGTVDAGFSWMLLGCTQGFPASTAVSLQYMC